MTESTVPSPAPQANRRWVALTRSQRRVVGVLIEKSKTTPDVYPMTVNAIAAGANQKSNRSPLMQLEPDDVQITLDELKRLGAVVEVQSDGRVPRFKHLMYDWLAVDRAELAVMAELLLRGHQTLGELRAHTARMEDLADLQQLRPIVDSLLAKELMLELTPAGRGQVVSHNLYQPEELAKVRGLVASQAPAPVAEQESASAPDRGGENALVQRVSELERAVAELRQRLDVLEF